MEEIIQKRICKTCEKVLLGRSDQKYCNDACRNSFNKLKKKKEKIPSHPAHKEIFAIIKRNYEILQRIYPYPIRPERYEYVPRERMPKQFDPDFFTSTHHTSAGEWFVCFDRGWRIEGERYHMKDFPEKAWT